MKEDDTRLYRMFQLLDLSNTHTFSQFKAAERLLKTKPWYLLNPSSRKPRVRLFGKQDTLHRQLYRYFIGEPPSGKLKCLTTNEDYNPWHWTGNSVPEAVEPSVPAETFTEDEPSPNIEDIVTLVTQREVRGDPNPWEGLDEFFEPDELEQAREIMNAD